LWHRQLRVSQYPADLLHPDAAAWRDGDTESTTKAAQRVNAAGTGFPSTAIWCDASPLTLVARLT
jgi:hypothetical protein